MSPQGKVHAMAVAHLREVAGSIAPEWRRDAHDVLASLDAWIAGMADDIDGRAWRELSAARAQITGDESASAKAIVDVVDGVQALLSVRAGQDSSGRLRGTDRKRDGSRYR